MDAFIMIVISYLVVFLLAILSINVWTKGWFFKFIVVKASRGSKAMMRINRLHGLEPYYRVGNFDKDEFLVYREVWWDKRTKRPIDMRIHDRNGNLVSQYIAKKELGVYVVDITQDGKILDADWNVVVGFDPEHLEQFFDREAQKPATDEQWKKFVLILMVVLAVLLIGNGYLSYVNGKKMDTLISMNSMWLDTVKNMTINIH